MTRFSWLVLSLLLLAAPVAAQPTQLTIVQPAEATTMDPGRSTQVLTVNYFYNLYDTLTRWDAALQLQPGLATSWKAVNETTWEFTLRPGVKFHDGAPFTAEDVRATIERNLVPGKTVVTAGFTTIEAVQVASRHAGAGRHQEAGSARCRCAWRRWARRSCPPASPPTRARRSWRAARSAAAPIASWSG